VLQGGGSWCLSSDEPIVRIVAKLLEVIVTKLPSTAHKTLLLERLHQVSVLTLIIRRHAVPLVSQYHIHITCMGEVL